MPTVTLRSKAISKGRHSLYLDIYPPVLIQATGKFTRREFLGIFITDKPKTPIDKQHNKDLWEVGNSIRAKRQLEILKGQYGFVAEVKEDSNFVLYFKKLANKRKSSNQDNWVSALYYLEQFTSGTLMFSALNQTVCNDFKDYLLTKPRKGSTSKPLAQNSALSYFNKFKATLKQAYKDELITSDLNKLIECIKQEETHRQYVSLEELQRLLETDCLLPIMKQAAIFSAMTGLRFSDIDKMTWSEVQFSQAEGHYIQFTQKKTKGAEVLQINSQAFELMGARGLPGDEVFTDLIYSAENNKVLRQWVLGAGIERHITFHSFRHTFATLQMSLGTDIYTVSKMLGHKDIKTTQIYTKVINSVKRTAADKISLNFNGKLKI